MTENAAQPEHLLTQDELGAVQMIGALHELLATRIVGNGPARWSDLAEIGMHIRALQYMVMSQASARRYPEYFRLLGEGIEVAEDPEDFITGETDPEAIGPGQENPEASTG
jgi:hypothetical protein